MDQSHPNADVPGQMTTGGSRVRAVPSVGSVPSGSQAWAGCTWNDTAATTRARAPATTVDLGRRPDAAAIILFNVVCM